uniref:Protein NYNRIN-like n=1 Tax=Pogona vitticeps TaxID=103695 RepID=A0ABM5FXN6_9SAUR
MPKTKRQLRSFIGTINFCRQWIEGFSELIQPFLKKLLKEEPETLVLEKADYKLFERVKKVLVSAPALGLPNPNKPTHLFVTTGNGVAKGVLAQKKAGQYQPIGYLSKHLDAVVLGWPTCLQACAAAAELVKLTRKLYPFEAIVLHSSHQLKTILTHTARRWMTDSRLLQIEAILLEKPDLLLTTTDHYGPAGGLSEAVRKEMCNEHDCIAITDLQTKFREDLQEEPIEGAWNLYTDGSSRVVNGKRITGYAIVEDGGLEVETGPLPPSMSAQTAELYALKRALEIGKEKNVNIWTDSKYACGVVHVFGKIWSERGLLTSQGKNLAHHRLVLDTLEALSFPSRVAIIHIPGHQKGNAPEIVGNRLADELARRAAEREFDTARLAALIPTCREITAPLAYSQKELEMAESQGATMENGILKLKDGRQWLPEGTAREILKALHEGGHWGAKALVAAFLQKYAARKVWSHANAILAHCVACQKVNKNNPKKAEMGGRPLAIHPFEHLQCDFIDMPKSGPWNHCLVITDQLTGWVEAFPTAKATAGVVCKLLLEQIVCRYGIIYSMDSDRGTHFSQKVLQKVADVLGIKWKLHTPWHPESSGKTERMNQTLKKQIMKLIQQAKLPWPKVLPLALFAIRTKPHSGTGLSPFESLYGMGIWDVSVQKASPNLELFKDAFIRKYLLALFSILSDIREQGISVQRPPLEVAVHSFQPGGWAYIKTWKTEPLTPRWLGPFQILLTTETAIRTKELGWTHHTRAKHAADPEGLWEATPVLGNGLKTVFKKLK